MLQALTLLRNRNFLLIWLTSIIEHVALAIALLSETWYVVDTLHLKAQLGWVMIAATVPRIALMAVGGVLADRILKTRILSVTFWLRMLVMGVGALLFWYDMMSILVLVAFAASFGIMDAFFWPARDALLPSIVSDKELTQANAIMQATNQIGMVIGPMIGGVLLSLFPLHIIFTLTAVFMAVGAMLISIVKERSHQRTTHARHMMVELREGIRYVVTHPILRTLMLVYVVANLLFMGPSALGIPIIASEHLTTGATGLSYLQSALAAGMVLGFLTLLAFPPTKKRLLLITCLIMIEGVTLGILAHVYVIWLAVGLQLLQGFCIACNNVPMLSLIQQHTDRGKLGRVMSLNSIASMGLSPISYAMVSALLSGGVSIGVIMPAFGLTMASIMLLMIVISTAVRTTD